MTAYLTSYLGIPTPPPSPNVRTALVAICPASFRVLPQKVPDPDNLKVPVCYFSLSSVTNDPPVGNDVVQWPFGRPSGPYAPNQKASRILHPSDSWAMTDCDYQLV